MGPKTDTTTGGDALLDAHPATDAAFALAAELSDGVFALSWRRDTGEPADALPEASRVRLRLGHRVERLLAQGPQGEPASGTVAAALAVLPPETGGALRRMTRRALRQRTAKGVLDLGSSWPVPRVQVTLSAGCGDESAAACRVVGAVRLPVERQSGRWLAGSTELVQRIDTQGRVIEARTRARDWLGLSPGGLIGGAVVDWVHPDDRARFRETLRGIDADNTCMLMHRVFDADRHATWVQTDLQAVRDVQSGAVVEVVAVSRPAAARRRAEAERDAAVRRLKAVAAVTPASVSISVPGERRTLAFLNDRARSISGFPNQRFYEPGFAESRCDPEALPGIRAAYEAAYRTGHARHEYRFRHADGTTRWLDAQLLVTDRDEQGATELLSFENDVTEARRDAHRVRAERDLLQSLLRTGLAAVLVFDTEGQITFANGRSLDVLGIDAGTAEQRTFNDAAWRLSDWAGRPVADDELPFARVAAAGEPVYDAPLAIRWPDGTLRKLLCSGEPLRDDAGRITQVAFSVLDVTEQQHTLDALVEAREHDRALADRYQRLLTEVNHRVRNNLAGLLGLLRPDARAGALTDPAALAALAVRDRVHALARVHDLLADAGWHPLNLGHVVRETLRAQRVSAQLAVAGPDVALLPTAVQPLAMTLNELLTNAVKHGPATRPDGRLDVHWSLTPATAADPGSLRLRWTEHHPAPIAAPGAPSAGTQLIRGLIEFELGGRVTLRFPPTGADHTIDLPLPRLVADRPQTPAPAGPTSHAP